MHKARKDGVDHEVKMTRFTKKAGVIRREHIHHGGESIAGGICFHVVEVLLKRSQAQLPELLADTCLDECLFTISQVDTKVLVREFADLLKLTCTKNGGTLRGGDCGGH